jgi:hypothetical protein
LDMVLEEGAPSLRRRSAPPGEEPGDGALGHINPEFGERPMNSGRSPKRISGGHFADEGHDRGVDRRPANLGPGARAWPGTRGIDAAANAAPSRESRTRGTASTRPRPWSARSRTGGQPGPADRRLYTAI